MDWGSTDRSLVYSKRKNYYNPKTVYETIYDTESSCLSILITNHEYLSLLEIKLILLGKSKNIPFITEAKENKKSLEKTS